MRAFFVCLKRDVAVGWQNIGDLIAQLGFYLMIATLFPLAVGPAPQQLEALAVSVIWIAALLSVAPSFDRQFSADLDTGWLAQVAVSGNGLFPYVAAKAVSQIILSTLPLMIFTPVIAGLMGLSPSLFPILMLSLLIGMIGLNLLGLIAGALTLGARRAGLLGAVLILPLALPLLIFGVMSSESILMGFSAAPHLALLCASVLVVLVITPLACIAGLRAALEET